MVNQNIIKDFVIVTAVLLGAICTGSAAQPEVVPESVIAQAGTTVRFNCTAMYNASVFWTTKAYGSSDTHDIYIGQKYLMNGYATSGRFSVEVDSTLRRYDLVIKNITQSDGGVYTCIDEGGLGKTDHAELIVWDKLECQTDQQQDSYMGENVFSLDQDAIGFTCRMNYKGNIRPQFVWSVDGRKFNGTQGTELGIASSSLILVATRKLDGANVTCEADDTGALWTSNTIRVKYAVLKDEDIEECPGIGNTLECNPPCSYKLETVNCTLRCAFNYSAGSDVNWFYFYYTIVYITEKEAFNQTRSYIHGTVLFAVNWVYLILLTTLLIGTLWLCFRRKKKSTDVENTPLKIIEAQSAVDSTSI